MFGTMVLVGEVITKPELYISHMYSISKFLQQYTFIVYTNNNKQNTKSKYGPQSCLSNYSRSLL